jgi:holo-[acyl-carrier protein] synthase
MIIGMGNDIIDIRRIEKTLERFGDRFINRIYTDVEISKSERRRNRIESYAKRYAAKEACSKALGTGFRKGVFWKDMGVVNLPTGRPTFKLTGGALERLNFLTPGGMQAVIHLTITDEPPQAQAVVLIEAIPLEYTGN